ncbi:MAG: phosphotransferase family protein [Actinomycetota bacterium]
MPRPDPAAIAGGLGELLGHRVEITGAASVGAQRSTLFIDIHEAATPTPAVAQISTSVINAAPVTQEAAILRAAHTAGVPVPLVLAATESLPNVGAPAMVAQRIEGRTIPRHILRALADGLDGEDLARQCGVAMARLHALPAAEIPAGLESIPGPVFLERHAELLELLPSPRPAIRYGLRWLADHPIDDPTPTLVHGDFRNGNIIVDDDGLAAVLDWELCQRSDPMQDLAWICTRTWRFGNDHLPVGGFGSFASLRQGYESAGGTLRLDALHWWMVARAVWWAIGLANQGVAFTSGLTDSIVLAASGRRVPELEYDLLRLISDGPEF